MPSISDDKFGLHSWRMAVKAFLSIAVFMLSIVSAIGILETEGFNGFVLVGLIGALIGCIGLARSETRWFKFTVEF